jgi:aspartyl-tRNA(Asn)/glutamyl-tRNA(Gln) amidotransferase subunit B
MRSKEQAHDYRYFPEPDLPSLVVGKEWQNEILKELPELPEARRTRMIAEYDISQQDAMTLTASRAFADSFEKAARAAKSPRRVVSLITSELTGRLKAAGLELEQSPVSLSGIAMAADLAESGDLSSKMLKQLLDSCFAEGKDFAEIYDRDKPKQISDAGAIEAMIDEVIAANPKQVAQYIAGKKTVAAFFVGNVMRLSKGQANPALLNELVTKKLDALAANA